MAFLFLSVALALVSTINAVAFYQNVTGTCDDLPDLFVGDRREVPAGLWHISFATFGQRCGSVYALMRPGLGYGDINVLPKAEAEKYEQFTNDVVSITDKDYYTAVSGGNAYVLDTDDVNYCYFVQCQEVKGQTSIGILFGSRNEILADEAKLKYDAVTEKLKEKNLFPEAKIHELINTNCPALPTTFKPVN